MKVSMYILYNLNTHNLICINFNSYGRAFNAVKTYKKMYLNLNEFTLKCTIHILYPEKCIQNKYLLLNNYCSRFQYF